MTDHSPHPLSGRELDALTQVFHRGAAVASDALEKWLRLPSVMTIDAVDQVPLPQAPHLVDHHGRADGRHDPALPGLGRRGDPRACRGDR